MTLHTLSTPAGELYVQCDGERAFVTSTGDYRQPERPVTLNGVAYRVTANLVRERSCVPGNPDIWVIDGWQGLMGARADYWTSERPRTYEQAQLTPAARKALRLMLPAAVAQWVADNAKLAAAQAVENAERAAESASRRALAAREEYERLRAEYEAAEAVYVAARDRLAAMVVGPQS